MDVQQFFATLTDVPWLLTTLDLIGIFFFATSGALLAARKQFDLVGSLALSLSLIHISEPTRPAA